MTSEKIGVFYLLSKKTACDNEFNIQEGIVCSLTKINWRLGKSILIACENLVQAKKIDEALWRSDSDSFLPHSLFMDNSCHCSPIVIYWAQCCYDRVSRDILINLMNKQMNFFENFNEIIDFVSSKSVLRKLARMRYLFYKNIGFRLRVLDA